MDAAKVYYDIEDRPRSIHWMVRNEPEWAVSRIQAGEVAIAELTALRAKYDRLLLDNKELYEACYRDAQREQLLRARLAELKASNAELSARVGELEDTLVGVINNWTANAGPRGHHVGCMCSGSDDGKHSCATLTQSIEQARAALAANPKPQEGKP